MLSKWNVRSALKPKSSPSVTEGFPASCSDSWSCNSSSFRVIVSAELRCAAMNVQATTWKSVCVFLQTLQRKIITDLKSFTTTKDLLCSKLFACSDMWSFAVLFYWDLCIYSISIQSIQCKRLKHKLSCNTYIFLKKELYLGRVIFIHLLLCHLYYYVTVC